jgi:hypothetical protein
MTGLSANDYLMSDFLNWNRVLLSFRGRGARGKTEASV